MQTASSREAGCQESALGRWRGGVEQLIARLELQAALMAPAGPSPFGVVSDPNDTSTTLNPCGVDDALSPLTGTVGAHPNDTRWSTEHPVEELARRALVTVERAYRDPPSSAPHVSKEVQCQPSRLAAGSHHHPRL